MAPVLEELKRDYAGILKVDFIDVWENPNAGQKYGIRAIPTQIFYDASGKELYRHMGFMSKEQILDTFKNLGVELKKSPAQKKK
jgi:thioredoxin 1